MMIIPSRTKPPVSAGPNPAHPLADRLAGCWLLNEGAGRAVRDVSGARHDGSFSGGPLWMPSAVGPAVAFDGNDDWISMGNCLNLGTEDVTVLALVQYSAVNQPEQWQGVYMGAIAGKGHLGPSNGYGVSVYGGNKIYWQVRNQSTVLGVTSDNALNDGRWHTAIGVCERESATGLRLYIDGVRQSATADPTGLAGINITDTVAFAIGSRQDSSLAWMCDFLGGVAAVCVWKRVLTEAEIGQLQREPFILFAQRRRTACLTVPAGTVVDMTGAAQAVSTTSATLQVMRGLAGAGIACSTATAALRKVSPERSPLERAWRQGILAHGLTPAAVQLATTLTRGWFWTRQRGCTAVYRGPSLAQVDSNRLLQVTDLQAKEITLPAHLSHPPDSIRCYLVRRFNSRGDREGTDAAAVMVAIGLDGQLAPPAPNIVIYPDAEQITGRRLRLTWLYCPLHQGAAPLEFRVHWDGATGQIDWEHPLATIPYAGQRIYQYVTGPLDEGSYTFAVRCGVAHQVENGPGASIVCSVANATPEIPPVLAIETM